MPKGVEMRSHVESVLRARVLSGAGRRVMSGLEAWARCWAEREVWREASRAERRARTRWRAEVKSGVGICALRGSFSIGFFGPLEDLKG